MICLLEVQWCTNIMVRYGFGVLKFLFGLFSAHLKEEKYLQMCLKKIGFCRLTFEGLPERLGLKGGGGLTNWS